MNNSIVANQHVKHELMQQLESDHWIGAKNGMLTLLEYGDYECESCASAHRLTKHLVEVFDGRVKFIYRHYPITEIHPHAALAAEAAEAAGAQGRFWEMHDVLFRNSAHLGMAALFTYAEGVELDMTRFKAEMHDRIYLQRVQEHRASGQMLALRTTPAFFLNGNPIDVTFGLEHLDDAVYTAVDKIEH